MPASAEGENPVAIGMMLCDQIIVDKDTNKPSLIGIFTRLGMLTFDEPQRFSVFVTLTNGRGKASLEFEAIRLDTGESIYQQSFTSNFPHPLKIVNTIIRVRKIMFPGEGWYDFIFRVNGELVAQRKIEVYLLPDN